jgi:hypothetical protein
MMNESLSRVRSVGDQWVPHMNLGPFYAKEELQGRIAERDRTSDPKTFALGGGDLVARPLPDQLAAQSGAIGQETRASLR